MRFHLLKPGGFFVIAPALVLALSSCSGGSGSFAPQPAPVASATAAQPAPLASATAAQPASAQTASVTFTMHWPAPSSSAVRKRAYVPATAMSVSVTVNGGTPQYLDNPSTTLTIAADAGVDTFAFATYDEPDGQGKELSSASVTQTITLGVTNTVSAVLTGIIAKLGLSISNPNPNAGVPTTVKISVAALDADGNTIIGANLDTTIHLYVTIPSVKEAGTLSLSATALPSLSETARLAYTGGTLTTATISAVAAGLPTARATFAPTPTFYEYPVPGADPRGIVAGPDGNMWFADYTGAAIWRVTPTNVQTKFSTGGAAGLGYPCSIIAAVDGNLWFSDTSANIIGSISTSGTFKGFSTGLKTGGGYTSLVDRHGSIWYTDGVETVGYQNEPSYLNSDSGTFAIQYGLYPQGIAVGPSNELYVGTYGGPDIVRITGSNENPDVSYIGLPTDGAVDIVLGPDNNMWFTEPFANSIGRLSPASLSITQYATLNKTSRPYAITVGQDQALWFTEQTPLSIGRVTTDGTVTEYVAPAQIALAVPWGIAAARDGSLWFTLSHTVTDENTPGASDASDGLAKLVY